MPLRVIKEHGQKSRTNSLENFLGKESNSARGDALELVESSNPDFIQPAWRTKDSVKEIGQRLANHVRVH
jgi:hypothetical protein